MRFLQTIKAKLASLLAVGLATTQAVAAPLTAADVPMTDTLSSITVVFLAILGVAVLIFGYRKIASML